MSDVNTNTVSDLDELGPEQLKELGIYFHCRAHCSYQGGSQSEAPLVIFAGADYRPEDGACGLREDAKYVNEPAIPYVRIDQHATLIARMRKLEADNAETKQGYEADVRALCEALWKRDPGCEFVRLNYPQIAAELEEVEP
ncbi:MAG: hypothetical protein CMH89_11760 [Oceanicaulis sp.]|uniref:hypothetical protein n=1 Tax=Oceanicaulis sp. TaxID=1924941 RepID=UPI000C603F09|nr:hypothetical protein [Oceanicaulis sp.]MAB70288.1 hypothetical protein [Oceanicaulis sp.]|tara:strand:+ start:1304 stop:1726 length:423 start_codon:yes stop_codon:yes gene_type:complete